MLGKAEIASARAGFVPPSWAGLGPSWPRPHRYMRDLFAHR